MKKGCVVGFGAIGPLHEKSLKEIGALYGVCDNDPSRLKNADKSAVLYSDYKDVLNDTNIDVVHICTPHYLHFPMARDAINAGKSVVLEKPIGISKKEVDELLKLQSKGDICIMLQNRKNPCVVALKEIIDSKLYGSIKSMSAFLTWNRDREYYAHDAWRGKLATEGGGLLINQAIHTLDLIGYLGGGINSIAGSISTKGLGDFIEVEDTADGIVRLNSGLDACFYATNCAMTNLPMRIEVEFDNCLIRYSDNILTKLSNGTLEVLCSDTKNEIGKSYWGNGHLSVIKEFYDYLDGKAENYMRLEYGENVMNAIFEFYKGRK